ncbi:MAG: nuclear transport factor 2 family protein [Bacteroidota bacterium]
MMKTKLLILIALLTSTASFGQENQKTMTEIIDKQHIKEVVTNIFVGTDSQHWEQVEGAFASEVLLDYTSMAGGAPAKLAPQQITESWKTILPGFDHTHHAITNFSIEVNDDEARVFHYGNAEHYLTQSEGGNLWTVVGTYEHHLIKENDVWKVDQMKFNLKYTTGNMDLPRYAQEKVKQSK